MINMADLTHFHSSTVKYIRDSIQKNELTNPRIVFDRLCAVFEKEMTRFDQRCQAYRVVLLEALYGNEDQMREAMKKVDDFYWQLLRAELKTQSEYKIMPSENHGLELVEEKIKDLLKWIQTQK